MVDARIRWLPAAIVLAIVAAIAWYLHAAPGRGAPAAFSVLLGAAFGIVLQRARFCFLCNFRDLVEGDDPRPVLAILAALATGAVGYAVLFGAWLPNPATGQLPPDAHIGPVSWVLGLAGAAFGLGMGFSGSCISGHLYRLGEGSGRAIPALLGTLIGFGLGFMTWDGLYLSTISEAPVVWLPRHLGYAGALVLQLAVLAVIGMLLMRKLRPRPYDPGVADLGDVARRVLVERWSPAVGGVLVGVIGVAAYFRTEPLGVTAQLGSLSRTVVDRMGLVHERLLGLDGFAGCATAVVETITDNGLLVVGLVLGSLAAATAAGAFRPVLPTGPKAGSALLGGVLMGWGAMTALGCTVGTLLSGIMAFAVSGWVFAAATAAGAWLGLRLVRGTAWA